MGSVIGAALKQLEEQAEAAYAEAEAKRAAEAAKKATAKKPRAKRKSKASAGSRDLMNVLVPRGGLQEDTIATIHFLNEYGPTLFQATLEHLDPLDFLHQVVYLEK